MNTFRLFLNAAALAAALSLGFSEWNISVADSVAGDEWLPNVAVILLAAIALTALAGRRCDSTVVVIGTATAVLHQGFLYLGAEAFAGAVLVVCPALAALRTREVRSGAMMAFWTAASLGLGLVAAHIVLTYPVFEPVGLTNRELPMFGIRLIAATMAGILGILPLVWNRMFFSDANTASPMATISPDAPLPSASPTLTQATITEHTDSGVHI